jgi:hypothetical protein
MYIVTKYGVGGDRTHYRGLREKERVKRGRSWPIAFWPAKLLTFASIETADGGNPRRRRRRKGRNQERNIRRDRPSLDREQQPMGESAACRLIAKSLL